MENNYSIRVFRSGDETKIVHLLNLVFNGWPKFDLNCTALDHWIWKFEDNPLKYLTASLAVVNDRIVGCSHSIPTMIKIGDQVYFCANGADVAVHPDFRRIGIYKKMSDSRINERKKISTKLALHFPGKILLKYISRIYDEFPIIVKDFVRIKNINQHFEKMPKSYSWIKKYGFYTIKLLLKLRTNARKYLYAFKYPNGYYILKIERFDDRINHFWNEVSKHHNFIAERKIDYLNWRYCDTRGGEYTVKQVEEDERILGYSVLRINKYRKEYPNGYIVDLLALPGRLDVVYALVSDAVDFFDSNNINIIHCLSIKNHCYEHILNLHGFIDSGSQRIILYESFEKLDHEIKKLKLSSVDKTYYSFGDYDPI